MGELADAGAAGFTDDGVPVVAPGSCGARSSTAPSPAARSRVHCEEPSLSRGGHMHEGAVVGRARARRLAVGRPRAVMVERDLALAAYEDSRCTCCTSRRASPSPRCARARDAGVAASGEVTPHHLVPHRRGGALARPEPEDEPAARAPSRPRRAPRRAARRHDRGDRDRPRAARAAREGRAVRGGAVRRHRPRDGVRGALHAARRARAPPARDAARADVRRPGARSSGSSARGSPSAQRANLVLLDLDASWHGDRGRLPLALGELVAARQRRCTGAVAADGRRRPGGVRRVTRVPGARGRHGLPRRVGRRATASRSARPSSRPR